MLSRKHSMPSTPLLDRLSGMLEQRRRKGLFRSIAPVHPSESIIDCSTNSYLGLHANPAVAQEAEHLAQGTFHGNGASRLVSTASRLYDELEQEIADWEGTESALVFTSGYAANIGILQALCNRSTEVYSDRLNHASLYDGIRLSGCRLIRYHHCDMDDLRQRLAASTAPEKLIVTDTVFSMDGDRAPLSVIAELGRRYGAMIMVDEAHGTGMFGKHCSGLVEQTGVSDAIDIRMGTLSKAVAGLGGYVAVSELLRNILVNFSRSLIYSTGLPHPVLAHNLAAIQYIRKNPEVAARARDGSDKLRNELNLLGFDTRPSTTQIVPCIIGNDAEAVALSGYLRSNGIIAPAIRPPTVPAGTARIRFSWSSLHTDHDRNRIIESLGNWKKLHE